MSDKPRDYETHNETFGGFTICSPSNHWMQKEITGVLDQKSIDRGAESPFVSVRTPPCSMSLASNRRQDPF